MLMTTSSASEVSCMLVAILLAFVRGRSKLARNEIATVLEEAMKLHPYNFLVRRLAGKMRELLDAQCPPIQVVNYLEQHLMNRVNACDKVAEGAYTHIEQQDILVVYGYSHTVIRLLTQRLRGHQGIVLVVKCHRNDPHLKIERENERITAELLKAHLKCRVVQLASLRETLAYFKGAGNRVKVLIGVRGVFNGGDVLSTVGNATIAATAKASDVDVLVLADAEKELPGEEIREEIEKALDDHAARSLSTSAGAYPGQVEVTEIVPIDRVTPEMYNNLLGVKGAATPAAGADA
jgi:translation initiation factor 2B subunit (eIF-2B alpha/beta/delta family)